MNKPERQLSNSNLPDESPLLSLRNDRREIRRSIRRLAIPNIISNITVPLLSLVDVGLAGHLPNPGAIAAIAIAAGAINTLYWLFSFLRMGTTGYVAQAFGRQNVREITLLFSRGLLLALIAGTLLMFARPLVVLFAQFMSQEKVDIASQSGSYLQIALFGAPAAMLLYVLYGWFIGMQNARAPMVAAITINVVNIAVSFCLVRFGGFGVEGLALGTVAAQYIGVLFLLGVALKKYRRVLRFAHAKDAFSRHRLRAFLLTGKDIFFRCLMLSIVTLYFTYASVREGMLVVEANTLLLQLFSLFSYFTDGYAYAGEALTGRYVGMRRRKLLTLLVRQLFWIGLALALVATLIFLLLPEPILFLLSNKPEIIDTALHYAPWVAMVPIAGFAAFLWDGIFVGATFSRGLLSSMAIATVIFFAIYLLLRGIWGNNALWLAFNSYLFIRGAVQFVMWRRFVSTLSLA